MNEKVRSGVLATPDVLGELERLWELPKKGSQWEYLGTLVQVRDAGEDEQGAWVRVRIHGRRLLSVVTLEWFHKNLVRLND